MANYMGYNEEKRNPFYERIEKPKINFKENKRKNRNFSGFPNIEIPSPKKLALARLDNADYINSEANAILKAVTKIEAPLELLAGIRFDSFASRNIAHEISGFWPKGPVFYGYSFMGVPKEKIAYRMNMLLEMSEAWPNQIRKEVEESTIRDKYVEKVTKALAALRGAD